MKNGNFKQEVCSMSVALPVSACAVYRCSQQLGDHFFGFPWQCSIERNGYSGAPNDKARYMNDTISSFQSRYYVQYSEGRIHVRTLRRDRMLSACIGYRRSGPAPDLMALKAIGYMTRTSLDCIDRNRKADWNIFTNFTPCKPQIPFKFNHFAFMAYWLRTFFVFFYSVSILIAISVHYDINDNIYT